MALFHFGKKKEEKTCCTGACGTKEQARSCGTKEPACSCGTEESACSCGTCGTKAGVESIKVLGGGCASCRELYENAKSAAATLGLSVEVGYVTDMEKIMPYGAMRMPALVVNERVVSMGRVLRASEVEEILKKSL